MYILELAGQDDPFAVYEARSAASDVTIVAPGLATARGITDRFETLAFSHRASELLGRTDPSVEDARTLLSAASIDREGSVAVRAVDVRGTTGIDTQVVERELGDVLVERGFEIELDDPDHELRALFSTESDDASTDEEGDENAVEEDTTESTCALGWLAAESQRDFSTRQPGDRPFFQPGSMDPMLARALANMAGARPGSTVLDPMCGTGGILLEAGLAGARVLGADAQHMMVQGSHENLAAYLDDDWALLQGDAASLPLADDAVDGVVFDTPYGRQSKIAGELDELVRDALAEARRVASRCVVVGDRPWTQPATAAGWTVDAAFERRVHRSLTRYILVLREERSE